MALQASDQFAAAVKLTLGQILVSDVSPNNQGAISIKVASAQYPLF